MQINPCLKSGDNLLRKEISQHISASQTLVNLHNPCFKSTNVLNRQPIIFSIANTKAMPRSVLNSSLSVPLVLWDADGKTIFGAGDSVWVSGSSVPGA